MINSFFEFDDSDKISLEDIEQLEVKPRYGWIYLSLPEELTKEMREQIDPKDLIDSNDELDPLVGDTHLTIFYGIPSSFNMSANEEKLNSFFSRYRHIFVEPFSIDIFDNDPNHDVLIIKCKGDNLYRLNGDIQEYFKNWSPPTYPNYIPHITIAYLKKGKAEKYTKRFKSLLYTEEINVSNIYIADADNNTIIVNFNQG